MEVFGWGATMKYNKFNRRMFLQGGLGTLAIPFLPSLLPRAEAAGVVPPKFIHFSAHYSIPREYSIPGYYAPNAVPWIQKETDTKFQPLSSIIQREGKISRIIDETFTPFAAKLNVISNCHAYVGSENHSRSIQTAASNQASGDLGGPLAGYFYSADYLVEQAFGMTGSAAALRINLAKGGYDGYIPTVCFGTDNRGEQHLPMLMTLRELKQKISGAMGPPQTGVVPNSRRSLIDSVLKDFNSLLNHRRISSTDKQRLGDAVQLWRDFEKRLDQNPALTCSAPNLETSSTSWGDIHRLALDATAIALSCGMTRTVAYNILQHGDKDVDGAYFHGVSHDPRDEFGGTLDLEYIDSCRWRLHLYTHLLGRLDSLKDENQQPLLDSCLVSMMHEYATWAHARLGHTLLVAGGANGRLDTGWHIDAGGAPINRFFLTNMMAMGLSLSQIEKGGRAGYGEYSTASISNDQDSSFGRAGVNRVYTTARRDFFFSATEKRKPFPYLKG